MHRSIYKVQKANGTGYRTVTENEKNRMFRAGTIRLEGVDGDEEENTVTHFYTRDLSDY